MCVKVQSLAEYVSRVIQITADQSFNTSEEVLWWRGHTSTNYKLIPSAFREGKNSNIGNFIGRAKGRLGSEREPHSDLEWLMLAQHYRFPSALLDWSENPLVALYFAVQNESSHADAAVYALSPTRLNEIHAKHPGLIDVDESLIKAMAMKAIGYRAEKVLNYLKNSAMPDLPSDYSSDGMANQVYDSLNLIAALQPWEVNTRIIAQAGRFTLHSKNYPLERQSAVRTFLCDIQVPKEFRKSIKTELELFGIRKSNLFPDLESLTESLMQ